MKQSNEESYKCKKCNTVTITEEALQENEDVVLYYSYRNGETNVQQGSTGTLQCFIIYVDGKQCLHHFTFRNRS